MREIVLCPVCGAINTRTYHTECVGLVEDYYNCYNCGYFSHMAYSPTRKGICPPEGKTEKETREKYGKRIAELGLEFIPSECVP